MIVVTGAAGVIGRVLMSRIRSEGIEAIGICRETFDLASGESLALFVGRRPEAIVHLAAAVPHSVHYPDSEASAAKTRAIDLTVRNAAIDWDCRLVYASTLSLYDKHDPIIKYEDTPVFGRANSPYMTAKYEGEEMFGALPSCNILRLPAPIGPGLPGTVVAKRFFDQAVAGEPISVWGTGRREQNYVNVLDLADAFVRAAYSSSGGVVNVAADAPTTMLELAAAMAKVIPGASFSLVEEIDPLEQEYARYSNDRARQEMGWRPTISLEDSIHLMRKSNIEAG